MKHSSEHKSGGKIRTARGFYIAVAICLLALAGIATVTFRNTAPQVDRGGDAVKTTLTTVRITAATTAKQVVVPATGVPDTRTTATTKPQMPITTVTEADTKDLFIFPASNTILHEYCDTLIYSETLGEWCTHNGVDFAAEANSEVKATADGTVVKIGEDPLWGDMVELDHGNKVITRCYGVKATVKEGQTVKVGEILGTVTHIPAEIVEESHIHLELLVNGRYQDPMTLIRGEAVRDTADETK